MNLHTLGLDIGGANLKAAHRDGTARTAPFALWKHPERLADELHALTATMPTFDRVAVTMTGELCDCYADRSEGVRAILRAAQRAYEHLPIQVWNNQGRFVDIASAASEPNRVASANWLAQAYFVARRFANENVLLFDIGSTTTDIVYLEQGHPKVRGLTDAARFLSGELVYTGFRRTPICAVLGMEVVAEVFATMLDAYVFLKMNCENATDCDTADGRPATREFAHARLARMRCTDAHLFSDAEARMLATKAIRTQWEAIAGAIRQVIAARPKLDRIVASGSGEFIASAIGREYDFGHITVTSLAESIGAPAAEAACAYAVAMLASEE